MAGTKKTEKKKEALKQKASTAKKTTKTAKPKKATPKAAKAGVKKGLKVVPRKGATLLKSKVSYTGPMFRVTTDTVLEPSGRTSVRDVIRHNGSVVILATDESKKKKDPWIVMERQYRYAAGQFLWELPAGKLDPGEDALTGAKRELSEETGYQAKKWKSIVDYFASPGFMGEKMFIFHAEGLVAGDAHPEEDEAIDFRLVRLSEVLEWIDKGRILDGKTMVGVMLFARKLGLRP
jgi:ADP-ribose pyrophosphatase